MDLGRVKDRERLKCLGNGEPHWQRIKPKCFVGFAPSIKEGQGTWHARAYDPELRHYKRKSFGSLSELPGNERFSAAKTEAERFADKVETGSYSLAKLETVGDACRAYAGTNKDICGRFQRYVYSDAIATIKLDKLRRHHLLKWRSDLTEKPVSDGPTKSHRRSLSSVNRDMAALRAALNKVLAAGVPNTEGDWQGALTPTKNADGRRSLYLSREQRRGLLQCADEEIGHFITALCLLPVRPGAMAGLRVADFDARTSELSIGKDKNGVPRRIQIPSQAAGLFAAQSANKLPAAPLFMRNNGTPWNKESWKKPIKRAVVAAGLPAEATAYTLRHSTITDLVREGLPLLTIAQISGTSAEMIERHYGHLANDAAVKALASLSL